MIDALEEARNATHCINLARANHQRLDQDKSNIERQGHWPQLKDKSTSALLHDPSLAVLIDINPLDTINPDQDIAPTFEYVIPKAHRIVPPADRPLANVYAPSGKLCGTITFERLQILYHPFIQSRQNQPEIYQQHHNPTFEYALARLLGRYANKHSTGNKGTKIKNHWATPDEYMRALANGLIVTTERLHHHSTSTYALTATAACIQRTVYLGQHMMPIVTNGRDPHRPTQIMKPKTWRKL